MDNAADTVEQRTAEETEGKMIGRPRIEIDLKLLNLLAEAGCSIEEIASMLRKSGAKVSSKTIKNHLQEPEYREAWEDGQNVGKVSLRSRMVQQSKLMNSAGVAMSIHLSKHWLGMTEKSAIEHSGRIDSSVEVTSRERVYRRIDGLAERIKGRVAGLAAAAGAGKVPEGTH